MQQTRRYGWLIALLLLLSWWQDAEALRCEHRLVSRGDTPADVLFKCGPPTMEHHRDEAVDIVEPVFVEGKTLLVARRLTIPVEVWTYNFGPHALVYVLTFRQDRVVDIHTRDHGY
jgi:hypothetical protein